MRTVLDRAVAELAGPAKVRVLVSRDGATSCEAADLSMPLDRPLRMALAVEPVDPASVFLYHQTTRRDIHQRARASRPDADAVLLWTRVGR